MASAKNASQASCTSISKPSDKSANSSSGFAQKPRISSRTSPSQQGVSAYSGKWRPSDKSKPQNSCARSATTASRSPKPSLPQAHPTNSPSQAHAKHQEHSIPTNSHSSN